jgi:hypothetical protein
MTIATTDAGVLALIAIMTLVTVLTRFVDCDHRAHGVCR